MSNTHDDDDGRVKRVAAYSVPLIGEKSSSFVTSI
jgi:hypothetical protein